MILREEIILEIDIRSNRLTSVDKQIWKRLGANQS
jgi:hypothetical protein